MLRKIGVFILYFSLFSSLITAEVRPITSSGEITYYLDYAGFNGLNGRTYQEFYLLVFADQFVSTITDTNSIAKVKISADIHDNFGRSLYSNSWITDVTFPLNGEPSNNIVVHDQWGVSLMPGEYNIQIEMEDLNGGKSGKLNHKIIILNYRSDQFQISEIEFVSNFQQSGNSQFQKGNIYIKPNPWRRYGVLNPILYFYFEMYNIQKIQSDSILINYSIVNNDGKIFRKLSTSKINSGFSKTVFHGVNVSNIPSGIYSLIIEISQNGSKQNFSRIQYFEVIQPDYLELALNSDKTFEISNNVSSYLMTVSQYNTYENFDHNLKSKYLIKFWAEKDPTPENSENEFFQTIVSRYNYVQKNYSWGNIDGWKTDRGKVVIKYGIPDDVNRNLFEESVVPYEIWSYQQEREFKFVFCDLRSDGRYALLHSTKEGEISNPDWYNQVKK